MYFFHRKLCSWSRFIILPYMFQHLWLLVYMLGAANRLVQPTQPAPFRLVFARDSGLNIADKRTCLACTSCRFNIPHCTIQLWRCFTLCCFLSEEIGSAKVTFVLAVGTSSGRYSAEVFFTGFSDVDTSKMLIGSTEDGNFRKGCTSGLEGWRSVK